jgi:hypothetical protein
MFDLYSPPPHTTTHLQLVIVVHIEPKVGIMTILAFDALRSKICKTETIDY